MTEAQLHSIRGSLEAWRPRHAVVMVVVAVVAVACSGDNGKVELRDDDAAAGGQGAAGGAVGAGGEQGSSGTTAASSDDAGNSSVCHASNLSSAPVACLQDWTHAQTKYAKTCIPDGGYQAHCDPYDAIVYHSGDEYTWCYYDTGTGNLIGARSTDNPAGTGGTCVAFDTSFSEPAVASCAPASGACASS
ncbi:MAG TPA: hypothetical protein VHC69_20095 [Polyangiaceae bacterium]|nr:hypothetical protein [Polyangiaceae bacterium]